eukprot:TRINITY_DN714_c0_g1_i1.p1 TRINITY_DN714_c0_g1~~TRINITY_DN714_c0_g1_i1.p1  ORF type:complete len:288 (-),score=60.02 TRINITY_DN714_c0_g1_i1:75-938(-)
MKLSLSRAVWIWVMGVGLLWSVTAWPGMSKKTSSGRIGPACTVDAHNTPVGACPNMAQPSPPPNSTAGRLHSWPNSFMVDWTMAFIPDMSFVPPYSYGLPKTPMNITGGRTFYQVHSPTMTSMRETYYDYCIPVFALSTNKGGCSFINYMADSSVGNGTAYVLFENPQLPACCVIGTQFHPPPPDFAKSMPLHYRDSAAGTPIDWNVVWDEQAGPFAYGFDAPSGVPSVFYMTGILGASPLWAYQQFVAFRPNVAIDPSTWDLPDACENAAPCPGWDPSAKIAVNEN